MRLRSMALAALLVIVLVSTVACSSNAEQEPTITPTHTAAPTSSSTKTPTPTSTPMPTPTQTAAASLTILIEADDIAQPAILEWMLQLESMIMYYQTETVRATTSIADTIFMAAGGGIPQTPTQIKGIIATLPPQITGNLITADYKAANIIVSLDESTFDIKQLIEDLRSYISAHPSGVSAVVTGMP